MSAIKTTLRRLAAPGIIALALISGNSFATAAESKPLSWGAIGHEPERYEPNVLKAINAKLPQYKFVMEGAADIAEETGLATGKYDMATGGYYKAPAPSKQFLIPDAPIGASLMKIYSRSDSNINGMKDLVGKNIPLPQAAACINLSPSGSRKTRMTK